MPIPLTRVAGVAGPRVVIVGAGVMGAAIAFHLARRGAAVTIVERLEPAAGATGNSFGWLNAAHGTPESNKTLRLAALEEYRRLQSDLADRVIIDWCGALAWRTNPEETELLVHAHTTAGFRVQLIDRREISRREPNLALKPPLAAYAPEEGAVNPVALTEALLGKAVDHGAELLRGLQTTAIVCSGGTVCGVQTSTGRLRADIVVLAAGTEILGLCRTLDIPVGVISSPSILLRFHASHRLVNSIISTPEIELRQASGNNVVAAEDYMDEVSINVIAERALAEIRRHFPQDNGIHLDNVAAGQRPVTTDGVPIVGFTTHVSGLYLAVAHPGVTLAPLLGRLATAEILNCDVQADLEACRPGRFAGKLN